MIHMQAIFDMNNILKFEDRFVLESCDFLLILLEKYFISIVGINPCTNTFLYFYFCLHWDKSETDVPLEIS